MVALGLLVLLMCSFEGISGRILRTLEAQYPPLNIAALMPTVPGDLSHPGVKWIVVLAGGVSGDAALPIQLQISHHSRVRLMEGIRLYHLLPGSKIILTGGIGFDGPPEATTLSRVAQELGVSKFDMVLEVESRDTKDHPLYVRDLVKQDPFILVTSAFHMPRAMKLFAKQGLNPIPAPAGPWKPAEDFWSPSNLFPSASGIRLAELAYHEYMGLTWAWIRGQI
ncbi:MAG: YdcF family protein [Nitrospirota bacterium]|nr:YdcF family protein [Nitrospirota bacterium]MDH5586648.1 YdcF family protein [Nitrospirota bacterium]MDH5774433.1 YdcF family protein [Nitrospirota bacterium]